MLHKPKEALEDVLKVLKWRSSDFEGLCVHAEIFHQLGQFEKSLLVWHRVKKIRPRCNLVRRSSFSCLGCCSLETSSEAKASKQLLRCWDEAFSILYFLIWSNFSSRLTRQLRASRTELRRVYKIALNQMISKFWSRLTNNTNHENFVDIMEMVLRELHRVWFHTLAALTSS